MTETESISHLNFDLSEDQELLRETVRRFAEDILAAQASELDRTATFPRSHWEALQELGITGLPVPEEHGGAGMDELCYVLTLEEVARCCASTALVLGCHVSLGALPIAQYGSEEQRRDLLPALASGERVATLALHEEQAGSDLSHVETIAEADGDFVRLTGEKTFVTNVALADLFLVVAREGGTEQAPRLSIFLVDRGTEGLSFGRTYDKLGTRAATWGELALENCRVPVARRLGAPGAGSEILGRIHPGNSVAMAALALGVAQGAFEKARRYAGERETFGKPIGEHQAVALKLADMALSLEAARHLVYDAARRLALGRPASPQASFAKVFASEAAVKIAYDAIQVHGGYGYSAEYAVERMWRDAKFCTIAQGTNDLHRLQVAKGILG